MYHNLDVPDSCQQLWNTCQSLVPEILKDLPVKTPDLKILASKPIDPHDNSVYLVKNGSLNETCAGHLVVIYEEGDLVGIDGILQTKTTAYKNDFAVTVDEYDGADLLDAIRKDQNRFIVWNQYLACLSQSFQIFMGYLSRQDTNFTPEFHHYEQGDIIIEGDTEGDEVFTLLSGSAKVLSSGNEVGHIKKDEIFGAIAALTNTKRTASIIAESACDTIVVKSGNFRSLLAARPDTVEKLINDMARTIVSCNEKIIALSKNRT